MPDVLIELPGGEGVLRGEDGKIVVTGDVGRDGGQPLRESDRNRPVKIWLPGDRSLVGGLLAPGAVSAEVVDDRVAAVVRAGAYAAILRAARRRSRGGRLFSRRGRQPGAPAVGRRVCECAGD